MPSMKKNRTLNHSESGGEIENNKRMKMSNSEKKLSKQKAKLIKLEAFARRLDRRINLEREIYEKKSMFEELEKEIKEQEKKAQIYKQDMIRKRLEKMEQKRKDRLKNDKSRNLQVNKIINKERKKELILNKILKNNQSEYQQCYDKALLERKKRLNPIKFEQIQHHDQQIKRFINKRRGSSRYEQKYKEEEQEEQEEQEEKSQNYLIKDSRHTRSQKSSKKMTKSSIDDYQSRKSSSNYETANFESKLIQLKEIMKRQREYGDRVEKQYHSNNVVKTVTNSERTRLKTQDQIQSDRRNKLQNMKKPKLPFQVNYRDASKQEILRVKKSNSSPDEKLQKLDQLANIYESKLKLKGKPEDLERVSEINLAKAEIMLQRK